MGSKVIHLLLFSHLVMSYSLQPLGLEHSRLPCLSPSPGVCSNSCPSSQWCHPTISSSVIPFSTCLHSFPTSGSFPMSQPFASGIQNTRASASFLPINIHGWFPLGLTGLISLVQGTLKSVHQHQSSEASILCYSAFFSSPTLTSIHDS